MNPVLTADVAATLAAYQQRHGSPRGRADLLRAALDGGHSVTSRKDIPIHVTCGVIAMGPVGRVLQVRHRALDRWLFPGGHLESDDASLVAAAQRELAEETGLVAHKSDTAADVHLVPVDIDIHPIPANDQKREVEHYHADFRYVVRVTEGAMRLQADEVTDWRWTDPAQLDDSRLAERLRSLCP